MPTDDERPSFPGLSPEATAGADVAAEISDPQYFVTTSRIVAFVKFEWRLAMLDWLRRRHEAVTSEAEDSLTRYRRSGEYVVDGWEAESEMALDEAMFAVREAATSSSGAMILSLAALLENLVAETLDALDCSCTRFNGLVSRWRHLRGLMSDHLEAPDHVESDVRWLADLRNGFAHRHVDGAPDSDRRYGPETVEDAFCRSAAIASALDRAYDATTRESPPTPRSAGR